MPKHATKTSFKSGEQHRFWKGGCYNYWHTKARELINCPKNMIVHHIDGNWKNNKKENLLITTQAKHAKIHNKQRKGQHKPNSKIRQVIKNVLKLKQKGLTHKEVATKLNINIRMVKRCCSNKWRCQYE